MALQLLPLDRASSFPSSTLPFLTTLAFSSSFQFLKKRRPFRMLSLFPLVLLALSLSLATEQVSAQRRFGFFSGGGGGGDAVAKSTAGGGCTTGVRMIVARASTQAPGEGTVFFLSRGGQY